MCIQQIAPARYHEDTVIRLEQIGEYLSIGFSLNGRVIPVDEVLRRQMVGVDAIRLVSENINPHSIGFEEAGCELWIETPC